MEGGERMKEFSDFDFTAMKSYIDVLEKQLKKAETADTNGEKWVDMETTDGALPETPKPKTNKAEKAASIANRLLETVGRVRFGTASAALKIHDGRVVDVTYTITESTREKEAVK
jgi:hypothetical protein